MCRFTISCMLRRLINLFLHSLLEAFNYVRLIVSFEELRNWYESQLSGPISPWKAYNKSVFATRLLQFANTKISSPAVRNVAAISSIQRRNFLLWARNFTSREQQLSSPFCATRSLCVLLIYGKRWLEARTLPLSTLCWLCSALNSRTPHHQNIIKQQQLKL